jgi:hypothetical protein
MQREPGVINWLVEEFVKDIVLRKESTIWGLRGVPLVMHI